MDEYNEQIIDCFVNSVYLYDGKIVITYNLANKKNELESSFLEFLSDPANADSNSIYVGSDLELNV